MPILDKFTISTYRPQAIDTTVEMDLFEFQQLRQLSNLERLQMAAMLTKSARKSSLRGLKFRFRSLPSMEFRQKVLQAWLQNDFFPNFILPSSETMWIQDPLEIALQLHDLLIALQVDYYITGGASAVVYGEPRTTRDIDLSIWNLYLVQI